MSEAPSSSAGGDPDQIAELFAEALELPAQERRAFLDSRCPASDPMRPEIDSLLAAHEARQADGDGGGFLEGIDHERGAALLRDTEESDAGGGRVGPYRLLRELGRGGMGVVHFAEREEGGFRQRVAIKLIKRGMDSDAILQRFLRERQILAGLDHPNVARLLDGGVTEEGQPWFAMEHVDGEPLIEWCDARRLGVPERLRLFEGACRAVQYAHGQLVVHRDLKPSNMLVTADGQLKLLDFGVAKLLTETQEGATLTEVGIHPLTPEYAAPEQVRGEPVTTATDVYALGLVLYELLAGRRAYGERATSREELARAACEVDPPAPSASVGVPRVARTLKGDLDAVVLKALRKEPQRRYASAEALADDVRRHLAGQPVLARPDSAGYRTGKFIGRHRLGVTAVSVATLSLLAGLLGTAWQAAVAARERDRARLEARRAEQVKEFLVGMFRASDPAESKGREITAKELLDRGTEGIEKDLAGQPVVQADLLYIMSVSFWTLGRLDRARELDERSIELLRKEFGPDHPLIARGLDSLRGIHYDSGDLPAAQRIGRQALDMRRRLLAADSADVAESMANLGTVLVRQANLGEAEPLLRGALEIRRKQLGTEHPDTARSAMNLADLLHAKGDYAAAEELHREALAQRRKLRGDLHPEVAAALSRLGATLTAKGDLEGAEAANREALDIRRKVYGEEHRQIPLTMVYLASSLHLKGDLEGAEAMYRDVLARYRKLGLEEQTNFGLAQANLGRVLADRGRFEEAIPMLDQAIALHERVTGVDHPFLATALEQKAFVLLSLGRSGEALPLLDRCVEILQTRSGPEHPQTLRTREKRALAMANVGRLSEAERLFRETLDRQRRALKGSHRQIIETLIDLGEFLVREGRAAEAEPFLREALAQVEQALPASHWLHGSARSALGECLWREGRKDEAGPLLRSGYDQLAERLGEAHPLTARARRRLEASRGWSVQ
ncbi:MAG TPA: serine/threonine-protein kinase [Candidatus Polarisedimenticolia bacterium]|jgi:serine/threonine-protein kinase